MKKQLLGLASLLALGTAAHAQRYPLVEIADIQTVTQTDLANCNDAPAHIGDTVTVRGIVTVPGGIAQSASGRQIWIRAIGSQGEFNNIGIRFGGGNNPTTPTDLLNVAPGDTLEIEGVVQEYNGTSPTAPTNDGETQINPLVDGVRNIGDDTGPAPTANLLPNIGIMNDNQRLNNLPTGEGWEGAFVKFQNVSVVAVTPFSGGTRYSFTVADAAGNRMEVSDRFLAGRIPPAGTFIVPAVGDQFNSISGVVIHSKNRCAGTSGNNRGYELNPFNASHYDRGASAPLIGAITRLPAQACSTSPTTFSVNITDDGTITDAKLWFDLGSGLQSIPMTATGSLYSATIAGQADGVMVKYYITATDNDNNVSSYPTTAPNVPSFFVSRCGGPTVHDIQYTPYTDGNSGYKGQIVTDLRGVVTSTVNDLGQVYIQDENATEWGGIWLVGGSTLATLNRGDRVKVTGTVEENFNVTRVSLSSGSISVESPGAPLAPIDVAPSVLSTYDFASNEKYEGMLVRAINPVAGERLYVIDSNISTPSNFGEYRLGTDPTDPTNGVVVMAGNQGGSNYSSLRVSHVNKLNRPAAWGTLLVDDSLVVPGDRFGAVTGIIYYGFNVLMTLPRDNADMPRAYPMTPVLTLGAGAGTDRWTVAPNPVDRGSYTYIINNTGGVGSFGVNITATMAASGNGGGGGSSCGCYTWRGVYMWAHDSKGGTVGITGTDQVTQFRLNCSTWAADTYTITLYDPATNYTENKLLIIQ